MQFIDATADDEMGLMFRVAVLRATRGAELCGSRWTDTDLEKPYPAPETGKERSGALLGVERPIIQLGGKLRESKAKDEDGAAPRLSTTRRRSYCASISYVVGRVGLEPTTGRL